MNDHISSEAKLRATVAADRQRIAKGERPLYHATWMPSGDGSTDITIVELPIIHLLVASADHALDGARVLIARTLGAGVESFDVAVERRTAELRDYPSSDRRRRSDLDVRAPGGARPQG